MREINCYPSVARVRRGCRPRMLRASVRIVIIRACRVGLRGTYHLQNYGSRRVSSVACTCMNTSLTFKMQYIRLLHTFYIVIVFTKCPESNFATDRNILRKTRLITIFFQWLFTLGEVNAMVFICWWIHQLKNPMISILCEIDVYVILVIRSQS